MNGAENEASADPPLTVELLAELQAGLLGDEAAARVRRQVRTDPTAAAALHALQQVRRDVADAGADPASAPDPPTDLLDRISATLRSAPANGTRAAHAARPRTRPAKVLAGIAGLCAAVAAIGLGTTALIKAPTPTPSGPTTAMHITISTPPPMIPLSMNQILDLLQRTPDFGTLTDPARRASCLNGLGYPASTEVLGARPIDINARPGVLLVLPGDTPTNVAAYAVAQYCSAADTGLLASTTVPRKLPP
ncbi:putative transmembrane transcriptional regulator (anti-sigma factor) [Mycobacterium basiliense]|uniref:Putative transmembrane transcriptional regulator (Anti-sigma factor) n=1 Tax=Mycobacterium basiliense TaxID=2094119 RepID=A0A447GLB7_9MYCO|nr:hypothetical protein [Mycobacterium basiliense]VDM91290.1 putative transmembrane transcriptional regulator (anti-sigma factor) [Mycobacterium basiliense]